MKVWGVGESTALRWCQQGCRTLDDVRKLPALTGLQQIGLKYFDDFEDRIPRDEVAEAEGILRDTVAQVIMELPELNCPPGITSQELIDSGLHARVMGSYLRGHPTTGDIDVVISAPLTCGEIPLVPLMEGLLARLLARGCITGDNPFDPDQASRSTHHCITWMGVWRGPGRQRYRRIDIKVYPRALLALAMTHFCSGQAFNRAIRYWCQKPPSSVRARAQALNPAANAFRLGDDKLVAVYRAPLRQAAVLKGIVSGAYVLPPGAEELLGRTGGGGGDRGAAAGAGGGAAAGRAAGAATADGPSAPQRRGSAGGRAGPEEVVRAVHASDSRPGPWVARDLLAALLSGGLVKEDEVVVGPLVPVHREGELFQALGLAYIPPHMRSTEEAS